MTDHFPRRAEILGDDTDNPRTLQDNDHAQMHEDLGVAIEVLQDVSDGTDGNGNSYTHVLDLDSPNEAKPFGFRVDIAGGGVVQFGVADDGSFGIKVDNGAGLIEQVSLGLGAIVGVSPDNGATWNRFVATAEGVRVEGASGLPVVRAFPFAFDTPDLLTGAPLYTPTPGDVLLDAWIEIDTAWDGTNAKLDLGAFDDDKYGWYAFASNPIPLDSPDHVLSGALVGNNPLATSLSQQAVAGSSRIAPNKLTGAPIKVCVSQDGTNTGDDPASTQGAATLYLVTATPVRIA